MTISKFETVNLINDKIHDLYFDIESFFIDRKDSTLKIRFAKNSKSLYLYKECELLIIKNVTIIYVADSCKIRYYDLNTLKYNPADGILSITSGFPIEIRIGVSHLDLELIRCEHEEDGLVKEIFVEQECDLVKKEKNSLLFYNFALFSFTIFILLFLRYRLYYGILLTVVIFISYYSYKNKKEKLNLISKKAREILLCAGIKKNILNKILLNKSNFNTIGAKLEIDEIEYLSKISAYRKSISNIFENKIIEDNLSNIINFSTRDFYDIRKELLQELLEYGFINGRITFDGNCFRRPGENETKAKEYILNSNGKMLVKMINRLHSS